MEGLHPKAEKPPEVTQQSSSSPSVCSLEEVQPSDERMNKVTWPSSNFMQWREKPVEGDSKVE